MLIRYDSNTFEGRKTLDVLNNHGIAVWFVIVVKGGWGQCYHIGVATSVAGWQSPHQ